MAEILDALRDAFAVRSDPESRSILEVVLRGLLIFGAALVMVRVGDKRFLARKTAFDIILAFVLASTLARAINGSAPLLPTIVVGFVLVLIHRFLGYLSYRSSGLGTLIKGSADIVVEDGKIVREGMRRNHFSWNDLLEDLRLNARTEDPGVVKVARIERNGDVSIIFKNQQEQKDSDA